MSNVFGKINLTVFIFAVTFSITACEKAVPTSYELGSSLFGSVITSPSDGALFTSSPKITISGLCGDSISVQLTGSIASGITTIPCSSGTFSTTVTVSTATCLPNAPVGFDCAIQADLLDAISNITATDTVTVEYDNTPTAITLMNPTSPGNEELPTFTVVGNFSIGDTIDIFTDSSCSGASQASYIFPESESNQDLSLLTALSSDGTYSFYAQETDSDGNVSACSEVSAVYELDNDSPTLTITLPTVGTTVAAGVTVNGACEYDSGSAVANTVSLSADDGVASVSTTVACSNASTYSTTISLVTLSEGPISLIVMQTDQAENLSSLSVGLVHDTTAPSLATAISIFSPNNDLSPTVSVSGTWVIGDTIVVYANDNTCANVGSIVGSGTTTGGSPHIMTVNFSADGAYVLYAKIYDAVGNTLGCSVVSATYTLDTDAPDAFNITGVTGGADVTADSMLWGTTFATTNWNASVGADVYNVMIRNSADTSTVCSLTNTPTHTFNFSGCPLTNGISYRIKVTATDAAGNSMDATNNGFLFTVDSTARTVSFSASTVSVGESAATAPLTVNLSAAYGLNVIVPYTVIGGTATSVVDYTFTNGSLTIPAGTTTGTINMTIIDDTVSESAETVIVGLTSGSIVNASAGADMTITLTINDNDGPLTLSVLPVYGAVITSANTNWNDYIKFDNTAGGTNAYNQDIQACDGSETGYYGELNGCIHSGEKRKIVVTGKSSCVGLTITTVPAGLFTWECHSAAWTGNIATFYTVGLAPGKGLKDLVSGSSAWQSISASVFDGGLLYGAVASTAWWGNTVEPLPASSGSVHTFSAGALGKVYVETAGVFSKGFLLNADKLAIVTTGSGQLTYNGSDSNNNCDSATGGSGSNVAGNATAMLCGKAGGNKFLWIETKLNGFSGTFYADTAFHGVGTQFSRFHQMSVSNLQITTAGASAMGRGAIYLKSATAHGNLVTDLTVYSAKEGIRLSGALKNTFRNTKIAKSATQSDCESFGSCAMITLSGGAHQNRFYDTQLADSLSASGLGLLVYQGSDNIFQRTKISNINFGGGYSEGLYVGGGTAANNNIFSQLLINGTSNAGISIGSNTSSNIFSQVTVANTYWQAVWFYGSNISNNQLHSLAGINMPNPIGWVYSSASSGNKITNASLGRHSSAIVSSSSTGNSMLNFEGFMIVPAAHSCLGNEHNLSGSCSGGSVTKITSGDFNSAFRAKPTVDSNPAHVTGVQDYSNLTAISHWLQFDNWFRSWGRAALISEDASREACGVGACSIWDFSANTGGPLYNNSYDGTFSNQAPNTDSAACVGNNVTVAATLTTGGYTYFKNAMEIDGDSIGNDNGVCEPSLSESCIWAPNIGAHQGDPTTLSTGYCTVSGAKIYQYLTN
jgi:hypothetical protein